MTIRRSLVIALSTLVVAAAPALAAPPAPPQPDAKKNANPCRDEVATALAKLRKSSWFRMNTFLLSEKGPTTMQVDYVLPDRMHQTVTVQATKESSEVILVGDTAWSRQNQGPWTPVDNAVTQQLRAQMQENVVEEQTEIGDYVCKGRTTFEGRDVLSYKLEDEPAKDSDAPRNEAYRMFYVDAMTGLPVSNALLAPGREERPLFKTQYTFPIDLKIEPPKVEAGAGGAGSPPN